VCATSSDDPFRAVADRLAAAKSLLIVTHARPDGDALGCISALGRAAAAAGKAVSLLVPDEAPPLYGFLFPDGPPVGADRFDDLADAAELVVVADTSAFEQLDGLEAGLAARGGKVVVIDHHATPDQIGPVQWIDPTAAATGVMVLELLEALGWPMDAATLQALAVAIITDTGWLRFPNTDGRALRALARLVEAGVRLEELYRRLHQSDRPERLQLMACMLQSLELHCDGALATMLIRRADLRRIGARAYETENLINEAMRLDSVRVAALLVEDKDCVRISLRSRAPIDVAEIAKTFGGGGHARASGARAKEDIEPLKARVVEACCRAIGQAPGQ